MGGIVEENGGWVLPKYIIHRHEIIKKKLQKVIIALCSLYCGNSRDPN